MAMKKVQKKMPLCQSGTLPISYSNHFENFRLLIYIDTNIVKWLQYFQNKNEINSQPADIQANILLKKINIVI
jgi:hypothetical protein